MNVHDTILEMATKARAAAAGIAKKTTDEKNAALLAIADSLEKNRAAIVAANGSDFKANERKFLPTKHVVTFTTSDKQVKLDMKLSYIGKDEDWETRTELSGKYRQVPVDDILRRFMAL